MKLTIEISAEELNLIKDGLQALLSLCDSGISETKESESDEYPDWNFAPDWANYWAMDKDNNSYWYEHKPTKCHDSFEDNGSGRIKGLEQVGRFYTGEWQDSLCKRE